MAPISPTYVPPPGYRSTLDEFREELEQKYGVKLSTYVFVEDEEPRAPYPTILQWESFGDMIPCFGWIKTRSFLSRSLTMPVDRIIR